jgi:dihydrofolate reductase
MTVTIVVAFAENRVIGKDNNLPWHLPADLKHFKAVTMGKPILMGRKTYESIGRPLPGRLNIVITRNPDWVAEGVMVVGSLPAAIEAGLATNDEVCIIGGAQIYSEAMEQGLVDKLELTCIHLSTEGDAFFPEYDGAKWDAMAAENHPATDETPAYSFLTLNKAS